MLKKVFTLIFIFSFPFIAHGKSIESLKENINALLETKNATVGVSILAGNSDEYLSINGDKHITLL